MIAEMDRQEADVVYAVRRARAGETAFKRGTAKLFYRAAVASSPRSRSRSTPAISG